MVAAEDEVASEAPGIRSGRSLATAAATTLTCCTSAVYVLYIEPYGSVYASQPRCLVRCALGRHPTRRPGAARARRRFNLGPCRKVPHDPHGHEETCWRLGALGTRHHAEGRTSANLQARPAQAGERGGMDREVPSALGHTLRRAGR